MKPDYADQLRMAYNKAKKEKNVEAIAYYRLLGPKVANVPFEKFKGSWAYGEWLKKPEVVDEIKKIQDEMKRFSWMNEGKTMKKSTIKQLIKECILERYRADIPDFEYKASDGQMYKLHVDRDEEDDNIKNFHYIIFPNGKNEALHLSPYVGGQSEFMLIVELYIKTQGKFPLKDPRRGNWEYKDLKTLADKLNIKVLKESKELPYDSKSHIEYSKKNKKTSTACTVHDINFGGSCMNCGYDPKKHNKNIKEWGMPVEDAKSVDVKVLDIADLEKLLANPDPERVKDYGSMNNYKKMLQKKIASLKSGAVNESGDVTIDSLVGNACFSCGGGKGGNETKKMPDLNGDIRYFHPDCHVKHLAQKK